MNFSQRYKESSPLETIKKIRDIIKELNVDVVETWMNSVNSIYSVNLRLDNTSITVNGKGTTKEFALASGYGELIERLQNMAHFRMKNRLENFSKGNDYIIAHDEVTTLNFGEDINQLKWLDKALKNYDNKFLEKFKLLWSDVYIKNKDNKVINLKYNSIKNDNFIIIPLTMVDYYYGTNGMAAGNSKYEALVQGLSEIIERATLTTIIKNKLSPPDVTSYVKEKYRYINKLISNIEEKNNNFKILIKDASLGKNIPVIMAVLIDTVNKKYMVSFGCHPCVDVAIERTVTELMQGQDINDLYGMTSININDENFVIQKNLVSIFHNGKGVYPKSLFKNKKSFDSSIMKLDNNFDNNKDIFNYLIDSIKDMGYEIYIRDESFLGFPTYHIIIPGLSEIVDIKYTHDIKNILEYKKIINGIGKIKKLNNIELKELLNSIEELEFEEDCSMQTILDIPVASSSTLEYINVNILIAIAYIKIQDYKKSFEYIHKYINYLQDKKVNDDIINYYQNILSILNLKYSEVTDEDIIDIMKSFDNYESIIECIDDINNDRNLFSDVPYINCVKCKECAITNECYMNNEYDIYKRIISKKNGATP